ncbi:MAG TPA: hypothetical protein VEZ11_16065 [Thermoanaerobaculia bacterium]|nr:hypothetical protein [Thermoanaerobaculia bacterium]
MLRRLSVVAVALAVAACASSTAPDKRSIEGGPGQLIEVSLVNFVQELGMPAAPTGAYPNAPPSSVPVTLQIEVANNSDLPETVIGITIEPAGNSQIAIDSRANTYNEMIDPGKDHTFDIKTDVLSKANRGSRERQREIVVRVHVALANGDTYHYTFGIPIAG